MKRLRRARQRSALAIALADLGGLWTLQQATAALTAAAATLTCSTARSTSRCAAPSATDASSLIDPAHPQQSCGMVVLALGKQGAGELNYSSDVDLVVFYDPECARRAFPASNRSNSSCA